MRKIAALTAILLAGGLAGCVMPPPPPPQAPLVAVPGPAKTEAAFRQDDTACRAAAADLPAGAPSQPTEAQRRAALSAATQADAVPPPPEALPPGVAYLRCMTARQNLVQPLALAVPTYAYYPAYPIYAGVGFGYPFFYDDAFAFRFGYGFGYGRYGGYGYGGRRYGDFRGYEGFREGRYGGGFRTGGFGGGGFGGRGGGRR